MELIQELFPQCRNFVLLGEAGCGKSELAINLSAGLARAGQEVHLFDLDMTKPLFRTRDEKERLAQLGIHFHYEEQFEDAPTTVGGVRRMLKDSSAYTILDVGGDYIGARSIGGYAPFLNRPDTVALYILNPFRPWTKDGDWTARVLGEVLTAARLRPDRVRFVANPNLGPETTAQDVCSGFARLLDLVEKEYISFLTVQEALAREGETLGVPVYPIKRYLAYPWENHAP